ncbi:sphingomyelin phosphodiesterase [Chitinimonas sp. BJB300]|uniref:sphingomyelin phosphodiesterase n=1 Tax=Chitinimonas sp. BJB300 TaxID=1559339 RepID=UPI000C0F35CF|nr:sphingomyelin phosphodiesterase [Chitinimonas sp. BJB300]PHV09912.1 sphingomyelin phosphodiesterase [Chitinimonas sp. BJB300]TSJ87349.1 sphingomyelin phosphodiesterase [Chitinimonas sp. BJB300]
MLKRIPTQLIGLIAVALVTTAHAAYPDDLKLTTWNTMLLPLSLFPNYGQMERAGLIGNSPILNEQDVVVVQEAFDNEASELLLAKLKMRFPYQTPVIGRSPRGWDSTEGGWRDTPVEDGGVAIASKWPIVEKVQYLYRTPGCGDDAPALKGFAYAKININGEYYHVLGTHLQSESSWGCTGSSGHTSVRHAQLQEIHDWVRQKGISTNEIVLVAGDFNVNKRNNAEYATMLQTLNAAVPNYVGIPDSFDTQRNGLALERYGARTGDPLEYLDYIVALKGYRQPTVWHNLTLDPPSPQWTVHDAVSKRTYAYTDYTDHYPVQGFAYADSTTPTRSFVDQSGSYRGVTLQNIANSRYVQSNSQNAGWLQTDANAPSNRSRFNLSNNFSMRDNGCIRNNDYLRIERTDQPGWFWTWSGTAGKNQYSYYTVQGSLEAGPELRLVNISHPDGCLRDGDIVAFRDWGLAADYYLTAWSGGSYNDRLYLWESRLGANEQFRVRIERAPQRLDWQSLLSYRPNH